MPGIPLSSRERDDIHVALIEDVEMPWAVLGRRVGRHRTTIMREVDANGGRHGYRPAAADRRAVRCRRRARDGRLAAPSAMRERIRAELQLGRSPVAIVLDMDADGVAGRPCAETIYVAVYNGTLEVKARECLRMRRPRRRSRTARNPQQPPRVAEYHQPPRDRQRPHRGGPLGSRSDHRRPQPVVNDLAVRTR